MSTSLLVVSKLRLFHSPEEPRIWCFSIDPCMHMNIKITSSSTHILIMHLQLFYNLKNGIHIYCATLLHYSELAKRGCKSRNTYNNEQYKIYKIVEGVSIHDIVHDVYPSFQSDDLEKKDIVILHDHA